MEDKRRYITKIDRNCDLYKKYVLKNSDLNGNEALALHFIRHNEGLTQEALREMLDVDKALITRILKTLEGKGFIKREISLNDKRAKNIYPTDLAIEFKNNLNDIELTFYGYLFEDISAEESKVFFTILKKLYLKSKAARKDGFHEIKR